MTKPEQAGLRPQLILVLMKFGIEFDPVERLNTVNAVTDDALDTILSLFESTALQVIGEDERLDIQSDFDKLDVPHLETDKYPGLDGVRQASRNLLRGRQRQTLSKLLGRGEEG